MKNSLKKIMIAFPYLYIILKINNPKKIFVNIRGYKALKNSSLFDKEFYIQSYKNIGIFKSNPLLHYLLFGYKKNYNPSKGFGTEYYLKKYKKVKKADLNPLVHYIFFGKNEKKFPNLEEEKKAKNIKLNELIEKNYYITDSELTMHYIKSKEDFLPNDVKIGVFVDSSLENPNASYIIRISHILNKIAKEKKYKFFVYSIQDEFEKNIFNYKCFDIIIVHRIVNEDILKIIIDKCEKYDIKIVYDIDDALLILPETHPSYGYMLSHENTLKLLAKKADTVVTSTEKLKEIYLKYNKNVEVAKNYLIPQLLDSEGNLLYKKRFKELNNEKLIKIGYYGTATHKEDFSLIKNSINKVVQKVKENGIDIKLDVVGIFKNNELNDDWINIFENFAPYIQFLKNVEKFDWDIGIAPLVDDEFNSGKSELKYLEYTSLGIPSICSDVKPYNSAIEEGYNGFLAKNPKEWEEKLEKLVLNESLRDEIVKNSINDINQNYLIDNRVTGWKQILKKLSEL